MGRHKRPHAPGMAFHLFTRTHHSRKWFAPELRAEITHLIPMIVGRTDASLLAYAIMPNHLHLIIRQGNMELSDVMQPLLRRVAYRVQRFHGFQGGVFERRFRERLCRTQSHLRIALVYTHLNPWRAGLCGDDLDYAWMSHGAYTPGSDPSLFGIDPIVQLRALELFALSADRARDQLCHDYLRRESWRMDGDRARTAPDIRSVGPPPRPRPAEQGFRRKTWTRHFAGHGFYATYKERPAMDLRDFILSERDRLRAVAPLERLRGSWIPRPLGRLRALLIRAAAERGYRTSDLARFFGITPQAISHAKYYGPREM